MHCSCELGKLARGVSKDCMRAGICLKLFVGEGRGGLGSYTEEGRGVSASIEGGGGGSGAAIGRREGVLVALAYIWTAGGGFGLFVNSFLPHPFPEITVS